MIENLIACIGFEEPFDMMIDGIEMTNEDLKTLCKKMNNYIAHQDEVIEELSSMQELPVQIVEHGVNA